jgi:probable DNA repair protein
VAQGLLEAANAGRTVLTPNTELAAALFDAIERVHREAGHDIWPTPRVRDLDSWLKERHVWNQFADGSTARCLSGVEERELWRSVVLESESSGRFLEPSGAALAARRARRAVHEYGIPLGAIARFGSEEALAFLEWNARFDARLRACHCVSADQLLTERVMRSSEENDAEPIAWIESPAWRPIARRWLQGRAGDPLQPLVAKRRGESRIFEAGSAAAELAAVAAWACANLRASPGFRAWIYVPDLAARRAELVDAFDAVLAPQRFSLALADSGAPYAVAGGTPLADYAPVRSALDFLRASAGPISFEQFSILLRSPELQAAPDEAAQPSASEDQLPSTTDASAAALLDIELRSRAPSEAPLSAWLQLAEGVVRASSIGPVAALQRLEVARTALEELRGTHLMSGWVSLWVRAFEAGPWRFRHRWSSTEYQSAERFRELLATLATADSLFGAHSRQSAEGILRRVAHDTPFQVETGIPPIWISGQLMDPWLPYGGLWVTGCDEERWPPRVDPVSLLPVQLQRQYGVIVAGVHSQLQFAEDLQHRWQSRADACVFSCADTADGRRAAPSPLLRAVGAKPFEPQGPVAPQPHWLAQLESRPALLQLTDEVAPVFGTDEHTRGVSTLRAQSRCAFRGFAETRLSTEPLERPTPGFNNRERGELLHHALQLIWSQLRDSRRLREFLSEPNAQAQLRLLDEGALQAIEKLCRRRDPGDRWRARERVRLPGLLNKWLRTEAAREPFEVECLEQGALKAHHAGLEFSVRIDRVDRLEDGVRVLIDYKTGSAGPDWRGERPDNPQLPIYALLRPESLAAVAYGRVNAADCSFVAEAERSGIFKPGGQRTKMEGAPSLSALMRLWSQRIEKLAAEFAAGRAAVDPTPIACRSCHLHGLCRVPSTLAHD